MMISSLATAIFIFGKFMMGVFKAMDRMHYLRPPNLDVLKLLSAAFQIEKGWMIGGLSLLFLIWIWGMGDVIVKTKNP